MSDIRILPENLVNKIAAGEVVERPSAAVKELLENSLDAQARHIEIHLEQGGRKTMTVMDDGCGIPADQLPLAVARHGTSKISCDDDLYNIRTNGFRGEALASLAAVSRFKIVSRPPEKQEHAFELVMEDGKILSQGEAGHPVGTTVSVKYLFHQTPARLKFLKSPETELGHIEEVVVRAALANPDVGFKLTHEGKTLIDVKPGAPLHTRLAEIFDSEVAGACYEINWQRDAIAVYGLVGHPHISRSHQRHLYLFVNGRPVRDRVLHHAVVEAYRDLLMRGRYPFAVVFVNLPADQVDVNVHPAKTEVRFANSQVMHRAVYEAVRTTLTAQPWKGAGAGSDQSDLSGKSDWSERVPPPLEPRGTWQPAQPVPSRQLFEMPQQPAQAPKQIEFGKSVFTDLEIVGQLFDTFIVCERGSQMVLIDQHAAHERIGFEKLMGQYTKGLVASQGLLLPENIDLSPSETAVFQKLLPDLSRGGFDIEFFGGNTFIVRAVPALLAGRCSLKNLLPDIVGDVLEKGHIGALNDQIHALFARMACHAAIRAHDKLELPEMRALLSELEEYQFTSFCPHGRPVSVEVSRTEIERWFKRIL